MEFFKKTLYEYATLCDFQTKKINNFLRRGSAPLSRFHQRQVLHQKISEVSRGRYSGPCGGPTRRTNPRTHQTTLYTWMLWPIPPIFFQSLRACTRTPIVFCGRLWNYAPRRVILEEVSISADFHLICITICQALHWQRPALVFARAGCDCFSLK